MISFNLERNLLYFLIEYNSILSFYFSLSRFRMIMQYNITDYNCLLIIIFLKEEIWSDSTLVLHPSSAAKKNFLQYRVWRASGRSDTTHMRCVRVSHGVQVIVCIGLCKKHYHRMIMTDRKMSHNQNVVAFKQRNARCLISTILKTHLQFSPSKLQKDELWKIKQTKTTTKRNHTYKWILACMSFWCPCTIVLPWGNWPFSDFCLCFMLFLNVLLDIEKKKIKSFFFILLNRSILIKS